jgi:uncharacterized RDD family membrane protein YckC
MEITTVKQAEETYKQWHRDFVVEEFLQKKTNAEVQQVLADELNRRKITLEDVQKIVKKHKLDEYPIGLTYSNLSLRADRVMAELIDAFYIFLAYVFIVAIVWILNINEKTGINLFLVIWLSYFLIKDALPNGQSFGKKSVNIKVVSIRTGKNCSLLQSFLRNIVFFIPVLSIADLLWIGRYERQRIGDVLAGTIVIDAKN